MSKLYIDILDKNRQSLFKNLSKLVDDKWLLGGGTALALQIGHRKSYDFDIFLPTDVPQELLTKINQQLHKYKVRPVVDIPNELSILLDEKVKITFLKFPFPPLHKSPVAQSMKLFSLSDLASNKAYVIGRRGEWKDYVDLYFLLKKSNLHLNTVVKETEQRFGSNFSKKLFWEQLIYWNDLKDFKIEYIGKPVTKESIQQYFKKITLEKFSN